MTTTTSPPSHPDQLRARLKAALALHQQGQFAQARVLYEGILRDHPGQADALHLLGLIYLQARDAAKAVELISQAIATSPSNPDPHLNLAAALLAQGRRDAALAAYDHALVQNPDLLNAHLGRASLLSALGRGEEAVSAYERALALNPNHAEVYFNLGNLLLALGRTEEAVACYDHTLALRPDLAVAHVNAGSALLQLGKPAAALERIDRALTAHPDLVEAHAGRGNALLALGRPEEAVTSYKRALTLRPGYVEALRNLGKVQFQLTLDAEAAATLEAVLALKPDDAEALVFLGSTYTKLHRNEAALAAFDRALALTPDNFKAWLQKSNLLLQLQRFEETLVCRKEAFRLRPDHAFALGELLIAQMYLCDWTDFTARLERLQRAIARGELALMPFAAFPLIDSPPLLLQITQTARTVLRLPPSLPAQFPQRTPGEKIRLGYFSADFRAHPVAQLTAALFEGHDRDAFEVIGFAFGPPANDAMRTRLEKAFDQLIDVTDLTDQKIAQRARDLGIDIAIDLGGYTQNSRPGIFACRAAPVQVSYIGFLGTMGEPFMDYLIADRMLIPAEMREHYVEKIVWLPWYQANDRLRGASERIFSRAELGLPASGLVFACLNNHFKILPDVFECWMRILTAVPGSVLYLLVSSTTARRNLHAAAEARGVPAERVIFADRLSPADYLARYRVVDLFLDTWPCNAGATASDALCMGVPVLTCKGQTFTARMASSVLAALGIPELITTSPEEYERRAVELANQPEALAALRRKVEEQRLAAPLYDTARFIRYLEAALRAMHERRLAGQEPDDIVVAP